MPLTTDWFEKNSLQLKVLALIAVLTFVFLTAILSRPHKTKKTEPRPSLSKSTSRSNPAKNLKKFNAAATISGQDWDYTVNHYKCQNVFENQFNHVSASTGKKFLIVTLTLMNKTGEAVRLRPEVFDFKVHTQTRTFKECNDTEILEVADDYYGKSGDVLPGTSVVGNVIFEIPARCSTVDLEIGCDGLTCKLAVD